MTHSAGTPEDLELTVRRSLSTTAWDTGANTPGEDPSTQNSLTHIALDNLGSQGAVAEGTVQDTGAFVNESSLAPVDEGFGAWSFLVAAFFIEAIVWSFPDAFGVFLNAYLQDPKYSSQKNAGTLFPLIGTLSSGIMYCSGVIIYPLLGRYPQYKRIVMIIGGFCCFASLFGASYVTRVDHLVFLQGVLYAIGGSMLYAPAISYTPEWFVKRRGLANGLIFSGTGVGGIILPIVLTRLLKSYGIPRTLQILSIAIVCLTFPFFPFVKGRLPLAQAVGPAPRSDSRNPWLKNSSFWIFIAANTLHGFGYSVPILWLPTFATDMKVTQTSASIILALFNAASIVGRTAMGTLSDRFDPWVLAFPTLAVTAFSTFVLWGVASYNFAGLLAFGLAYGITASGWPSLWMGFIKLIAQDDHVLTNSLFSYLLLSRGIGNIFSTPISTSLLHGNATSASGPGEVGNLTPSKHLGFNVGEGRFQNVIVYVGTCFAGASIVAIVGLGMDRWRRRAGGGGGVRSGRE